MTEETDACEVKSIEPVDIDQFEKLGEVLGVLSNKTRLAIITIALEHGSVCACRLQESLGLPQPTVTVHLQKLYSAGLLRKREAWRYTYYSIKEEYGTLTEGRT
ncbi:ArsR family transcriptional regulator, partial [mine drainage metagenome]